MDSKLRKQICDFISSLHLKAGDRLPSIEQIRRKVGSTQYKIYQELKEIAVERKYEIIHGSGIYLPGRKKVWKPYEYSVALVFPAILLENSLINTLHYRFMKHNLNLLPLGIPHNDPGLEEETLRYLLGRRVWGLIIDPHPLSKENLKIIARMQTQGCRCILVTRPPDLKKRFHYFTFDYTFLGRKIVEFALKNNYKKIFFINQSYSNWHMIDLEKGLVSAAKNTGVFAEVIHDYLLQDRFAETWQWEDEKLFQLKPDTLYVVENVGNRASHIYNRLQQKGIKSSAVLTFCRRKSDIDSRIPCYYMNEELRYKHISDKLLNTSIWIKTGVETKFEPILILPGSPIPEFL